MIVVVGQHLLIGVNGLVKVKRTVRNAAVKVVGLLESHFFHQMRHGTFVKRYLSVFQPSLKHFLGIGSVFHCHFLQRHAYL